MRRYAGALVGVALMGGCMSMEHHSGGGPAEAHFGQVPPPPTVPGLQTAYGAPVPMAAPYNSGPAPSPEMARRMMAASVPLDMVQFNNQGNFAGAGGGGMPYTPMPAGGLLSPPGLPGAPGMPVPRGGPVMPAGFNQGMGDPMNGVIQANIPPGGMPPGGVISVQGAMPNPNAMMAMNGSSGPGMPMMGPGGPAPNPGLMGPQGPAMHFPISRTQVRFVRPIDMKIAWFAQGPDGNPMYSQNPVVAPGRYNFLQAAIYRLKLSNIEGRPGLEVYPTMEVVPGNAKTDAFLAHSAVPVEFTNEDFRQIAEGNYVVKVIYLPDPQYQDVAGTGTDEILSTRLEPGADPIQEALRRGSILLVIRMGNVDQEAPNTPALNAPPAGQPGGPGLPPGVMPGMVPGTGPVPPGLGFGPPVPTAPNVQVPYMQMRPIPPQLQVPPGMVPGMAPGATGPLSSPAPFMAAAPNSALPPSLSIPGPSATQPPSAPATNNTATNPSLSIPSAPELPSAPPGVPTTSALPSVPAIPPAPTSIPTPPAAPQGDAASATLKLDLPGLPAMPPIPTTTSEPPLQANPVAVPTPAFPSADPLPPSAVDQK